MWTENYLDSVKKQFSYAKLLGDKTLDQLDDDQLAWKYNLESNSIAQIVKHMHGNMLSRWTDFLTTDGEKVWRNRDAEFVTEPQSKLEIVEMWETGWKCLMDALKSVTEANFSETVYIRNQGHTITEAINRQLGHYNYHVGQIVYLGKMLRGTDWQPLSIPVGQSDNYNVSKFGQAKGRQHFTDEYLEEKN